MSGENPEVSLTSFADFVLKSGLPKLTAAQRIREQYERGYSPALDYYKKFRDTLRKLHSGSHSISELSPMLADVADPNKRVNYGLLARGYTRYWNSYFQDHGFRWVAPPVSSWSHGNVRVRVTPELAFTDGSLTYYIKLYCKEDAVKTPQVQVILHLMQMALNQPDGAPAIVMVDVRRGKHFEATAFNPKWTVVLEAEALAFERMYRAQPIPAVVDP